MSKPAKESALYLPVVILLVLLSLLTAPAWGQCPGGNCPTTPNYGFAPQSTDGPGQAQQTPTAEYHKAIMRVGCGTAAGTGTLVCVDDAGGYVLSAAHVLERAADCWADPGNGRLSAYLMGRDMSCDVAAIYVKGLRDLPIIPVAENGEDCPGRGDTAEVCGFGTVKTWKASPRHYSAPVIGYVTRDSRRADQISLAFQSISGDSGGPILYQGKLVAVLWGYVEMQGGVQTQGACAVRINECCRRWRVPRWRGQPAQPVAPSPQPPPGPVGPGSDAPSEPVVADPPAPTQPDTSALEQAKAAAEARAKELADKLDGLNNNHASELEQLKAQHQSVLEKLRADLESWKGRHGIAEGERGKLAEQVKGLIDQIQHRDADIGSLKGHIETLAGKVKDLQSQLDAHPAVKAVAEQAGQAWLTTLLVGVGLPAGPAGIAAGLGAAALLGGGGLYLGKRRSNASKTFTFSTPQSGQVEQRNQYVGVPQVDNSWEQAHAILGSSFPGTSNYSRQVAAIRQQILAGKAWNKSTNAWDS